MSFGLKDTDSLYLVWQINDEQLPNILVYYTSLTRLVSLNITTSWLLNAILQQFYFIYPPLYSNINGAFIDNRICYCLILTNKHIRLFRSWIHGEIYYNQLFYLRCFPCWLGEANMNAISLWCGALSTTCSDGDGLFIAWLQGFIHASYITHKAATNLSSAHLWSHILF